MTNSTQENIYMKNKQEQPTLSQILFPQQYENIFLGYYFILVPFILGHIFLFTYISEFNLDIYLNVCSVKNSFFTWCIGYEGFSILFFITLAILSIKNMLNRVKYKSPSLL